MGVSPAHMDPEYGGAAFFCACRPQEFAKSEFRKPAPPHKCSLCFPPALWSFPRHSQVAQLASRRVVLPAMVQIGKTKLPGRAPQIVP